MQKLALLVLMLLVLCSCGRNDPQSDAITPGGTESGIRSEAEAEQVAQEALQGDGRAAWALSFYFRERNDRQRAAYWEQIAILDLNGPAISTISGSLLVQRDICSKLRGIYLIEFGIKFLPADQRHFVDRFAAEVERAKGEVKEAKDLSCLRKTPQ